MKDILRMTHQRELILEELGNCHNHPTADALYERIKKKLPRISLATVYRNLEILSEAGMIRKLEISGRQKRFDKEIEQHDHVFCVQCRRVDDIKFDQNRLLSLDKEHSQGYEISGCRVEFFGLCPQCQAKRKRQAEKEESDQGCKKSFCKKNRLSDRQREVLEALAQSDSVCANKDIAAVTSLEPKQISCQLTALKKKGFVTSPVRCKYEVTEAGKAAL
ncbi:MAG: ArsR family transcriptional regulator [Candidatus Electrothrix sp. ATG1]|nr:ArsR family transcriptional regulator [Candidatus Electrothrix sp. ATG1]